MSKGIMLVRKTSTRKQAKEQMLENSKFSPAMHNDISVSDEPHA